MAKSSTAEKIMAAAWKLLDREGAAAGSERSSGSGFGQTEGFGQCGEEHEAHSHDRPAWCAARFSGIVRSRCEIWSTRFCPTAGSESNSGCGRDRRPGDG